jgi:hypothetical protein
VPTFEAEELAEALPSARRVPSEYVMAAIVAASPAGAASQT